MRVAIEIFTEVDNQTSVVEKIASITKYIVEMGFRVDSIQAVRLQRYLSDYTEATKTCGIGIFYVIEKRCSGIQYTNT